MILLEKHDYDKLRYLNFCVTRLTVTSLRLCTYRKEIRRKLFCCVISSLQTSKPQSVHTAFIALLMSQFTSLTAQCLTLQWFHHTWISLKIGRICVGLTLLLWYILIINRGGGHSLFIGEVLWLSLTNMFAKRTHSSQFHPAC